MARLTHGPKCWQHPTRLAPSLPGKPSSVVKSQPPRRVVPRANGVILSGQLARVGAFATKLRGGSRNVIADAPVHVLTGFATAAKHAAQGAALIADGLANGLSATLWTCWAFARPAPSSIIFVISPAVARARLGIV